MGDESFFAVTILAGYLVGGIPFGYLTGRWRGVDIFQHGSGNIGATNVGRVLGRKYGILVFMLDFAKGAAAVATALLVGSQIRDATLRQALPVLAGLAAFLGHMFPIYLRFRGGKGVATGAGVVAILLPLPALGALLTWLGIICATRYVSLASMIAAVALCLFQFSFGEGALAGEKAFTSVFCLIAAGLVLARHRANLARLLRGNENRLSEGFAMSRLVRTVHVLSLGLWFGSATFFLLVVAVSLFHTFESVGAAAEHRPAWLPLPVEFAHKDAAVDGPREQGSRVAGTAVAPLFGWFFLVQGTCGFLATATALGWSRSSAGTTKTHRRRATILLLALCLVLVGWPIERHVADLRIPRNQATDRYLRGTSDTRPQLLAEMKAARSDFATWHLISLGLGMASLALVTWGMALAAALPEGTRTDERPMMNDERHTA
ncbi:MAG: glycerol-3-phosphate 1-O-acyltransferase PlsY [Planctomycetes bacterium]|nr:glycerol-3-phosphate 1-O-acyltransferase PlsY [Planctomycetota bacterium]